MTKSEEFYFTVGDSFLHPEIADILEETLLYGHTTVLSNDTLITQKIVRTRGQIINEMYRLNRKRLNRRKL